MSSRVRTPTPCPRHRRHMREVRRPGRVYTYRPPQSTENMAYLQQSSSEIQLTRLWTPPAGPSPDAPPYYRQGDPLPLERVPSDDDPADWRAGKKLVNIGLVTAFAFVTSLTSAIFAPTALELKDEVDQGSRALGALVVSIFVLGGALGALGAAPASESWGRAPVYWLSGAGFAGLTAACGSASSAAELLTYRFLAGLLGSAPLVVGGATVADIVPAAAPGRAGAMCAFAAGPLLGVPVGHVVGGAVADARGWRWTFWALGGTSAVLTVLMVLGLRETCPAVLERRRALRAARIGARPEPLRSQRGRSGAPSSFAAAAPRPPSAGGGSSHKKRRRRGRDGSGSDSDWLLRSYVVFSPVSGLLAVYTGAVFGCFYLMLASVPFVFGGGVYDFGPRGMELTYLGVGAGALLGLAYYGLLVGMDARKLGEEREARGGGGGAHRAKRARCPHCPHCPQATEAGCDDDDYDHDGGAAHSGSPHSSALRPTPEDRLRPLRLCGLTIPAGLALYGWAAGATTTWLLPALGSAAVGFGVGCVLAAVQLYLADAFPSLPASAAASNVMLRSLAAGSLPMAGPAMVGALGVGWCGTVLGAAALALVPVPWLAVRYGEDWRRRYAPRAS